MPFTKTRYYFLFAILYLQAITGLLQGLSTPMTLIQSSISMQTWPLRYCSSAQGFIWSHHENQSNPGSRKKSSGKGGKLSSERSKVASVDVLGISNGPIDCEWSAWTWVWSGIADGSGADNRCCCINELDQYMAFTWRMIFSVMSFNFPAIACRDWNLSRNLGTLCKSCRSLASKFIGIIVKLLCYK